MAQSPILAGLEHALAAREPRQMTRTLEQQIADTKTEIARTERLLAETPAGKQKKVNDMLRMTPAGRIVLAKKGLK